MDTNTIMALYKSAPDDLPTLRQAHIEYVKEHATSKPDQRHYATVKIERDLTWETPDGDTMSVTTRKSVTRYLQNGEGRNVFDWTNPDGSFLILPFF